MTIRDGKTVKAVIDNDPLFRYHRYLEAVAADDIAYVRRKDKAYGASWKRRGGPGAFFTLVRPWDRFERMAEEYVVPFDVFTMIMMQGLEGPDGSAIACVRDMRRYLLLLECEMAEQLADTDKGLAYNDDGSYKTPEPQPPAPDDGSLALEMAKMNTPDSITTCPVCLKLHDTRFKHSCDGPRKPIPRTVAANPKNDPQGYGTGNMPSPPRVESNLLNSSGEPIYTDRPCWELEDGLTMAQLPAAAPGFYVEGKRIPGEYTQYIVNRDCEYFAMYPETIGHLPRLEFELNNKELECLPKWYHGLYAWVDAETKWRLFPTYQNTTWMK